jgi:uncharacterized BrkB/YihY/UPF0761 family membrane protein
MSNNDNNGCSAIAGVFWLFMVFTYINNIIDLFGCDFETPFKEEIIHLIGVFIPPASLITCWY